MDPAERIDELARIGSIPFDLDFLRVLGFDFSLDWDGRVIIEYPEAVEPAQVATLASKFYKQIAMRMKFEQTRRMSVCMGGPMDGQAHRGYRGLPLIYHVSRGKWAVYRVRAYDDPRAVFVGCAKNRKAARSLWVKHEQASAM